ncbi:hypothetical protein PRECH8_07880 [Insulibacter thermoxylanivorax]|uniref:Uncharacterized protein n=1 Tax=Insulibacter thermoxylanivorax TaxID=2749268 RepID=A0A916VER5_9BACL|nr:hypothetical protein PRECH8_07880 [Insulibacter thermoxylanivorax]
MIGRAIRLIPAGPYSSFAAQYARPAIPAAASHIDRSRLSSIVISSGKGAENSIY